MNSNTERDSRCLIHLGPYRGQWVALRPGSFEVVSHNADLDTAEREAVEQGVSNPILYCVPESNAFFVGGGLQDVR